MAGKGIILNVFRIPFRAGVAKSVDAVDSKSTVEIRAGSSPAFGTIGMLIKSPEGGFFCAHFCPNSIISVCNSKIISFSIITVFILRSFCDGRFSSVNIHAI